MTYIIANDMHTVLGSQENLEESTRKPTESESLVRVPDKKKIVKNISK